MFPPPFGKTETRDFALLPHLVLRELSLGGPLELSSRSSLLLLLPRSTVCDSQGEITCLRISETWRKPATLCFRYV